MPFDPRELAILDDAVRRLRAGFEHLPTTPEAGEDPRIVEALRAAAERLRDNYPYHHPLYIGQMLKPPHPVARLAYSLAMHINPNNHALDGGRASSAMEKEAIAGLARMIGWDAHLGHLCGGGTIANFEALWVARELSPGRAIAASAQAHYTHERLSRVLGVPFVKIDRRRRRWHGCGYARACAGARDHQPSWPPWTTAAGRLDHCTDGRLCHRHGVRVHTDAAYGGLLHAGRQSGRHDARPSTRDARCRLHRHRSPEARTQPCGCGCCVLYRDPSVVHHRHESRTYFVGRRAPGRDILDARRGRAA
jgi:hypothetical protein